MVKWKQTWLLVALAATLLAFILLQERYLQPSGPQARVSRPLLPGFKAAATTSVLVRRGERFSLRAERAGEAWALTAPLAYPASGAAIDTLLQLLEKATIQTCISASALRDRKQTSADFGLESPQAALVLQTDASRLELQIGTNTASGDQVYVKVVGSAEICVVEAALLQALPAGPNDWRNKQLFGPGSFDRVEITRSNLVQVLDYDPTNKLWRLARPRLRADQVKVNSLLGQVLQAQVLEFVEDDPKADLEPYGLAAPELEMILGLRTNTLQRVQFGRSPTNDPTRVYARRLVQTNIVLVSRSVLDLLSIPVSELRDRRLLTLPDNVDTIEVRSPQPFTAHLQTNGIWMLGDGQEADGLFIQEMLAYLKRLQVSEFVKDVVTDFSAYGLAAPSLEYTFKTTETNAAGPTNLTVAQLDLGTNQGNRIFVRRTDEDSVYALRPSDVHRLPWAPWQLRDHQVWSFTTNQVARVLIRQGGRTRQLQRGPAGEWTSPTAVPGELNSWALDETLFRLGRLRAQLWVARGATNQVAYGFTDQGHQITVELKDGEPPKGLTLEFGGVSPSGLPYAATTLDGQWWVFEFPWPLYTDLKRDLSAPPPTPR